MVRGPVVDQRGKRRLSGRLHTVCEGLDDRTAVLLVAHADTDRGVGRRIDHELEVHMKRLAVEHDHELLAVTDPLRTREEGFEAAAQRLLVARSTVTSRRPTGAVAVQDARDQRVAERDAMISPHVRTECAEASMPRAPRG